MCSQEREGWQFTSLLFASEIKMDLFILAGRADLAETTFLLAIGFVLDDSPPYEGVGSGGWLGGWVGRSVGWLEWLQGVLSHTML